MLSTSNFAQHTAHVSDSVKISLADYKFIREWSEFGLTCDSLLIIREVQVSEVQEMLTLSEAVIREQDAKIRQIARRKKLGSLITGCLVTAVLVEGIVIMAK